MQRHQFSALAVLFLSGCLFGKNADEVPDAGNAGDAMVTDTADPGADVSSGQTYAPLNATKVSCGAPLNARFKPQNPFQQLNETSHIANAGPPTDVARLGDMPQLGTASIAHATSDGGTIAVYGAAVRIDPSTRRAVPVVEAEASIRSDAEIFAISLTSHTFLRTMNAPVQPILTILLATSDGAFDCVMTLGDADATRMACNPSPLDNAVASAGVPKPERVDPIPILTPAPDNSGKYHLSLAKSDVLALVSGGSGEGEALGALRNNNPEGAFSTVNLSDAVATKSADSEIFAERGAFGADDSSFGFPLIMTLARVDEGPLAPRVLKSANINASRYEADDSRGDWSLSDRLSPTHGTFTFADGYDVEIAIVYLLLRLDVTPGTVNLGYVGIGQDGASLVFSRPGGFLNNDFLEFALADAAEVMAFKNIPTTPTSSGRPPIAVIHGADRDKLAVFNWGFQIDASWVENLLGDGYSDAQRMNPTWFYADAGMISMLAKYQGEWFAALVPIPDVKDLRSSCP